MKLLLASKSPRRRELLSQLGCELEFVSIDVDEHIGTPLPPAEVAEHLARRKATAYTGTLAKNEVLVTADTVVVLGNDVLGKPANRDEAIDMLHKLSGQKHTVYTGVCLRTSRDDGSSQRNDNLVSLTEATDVFFNKLSDEDITYYVDTYRPFDKAGAYGIQEWIGMVGISRIDGCYYNVVGLPVARLYNALKALAVN